MSLSPSHNLLSYYSSTIAEFLQQSPDESLGTIHSNCFSTKGPKILTSLGFSDLFMPISIVPWYCEFRHRPGPNYQTVILLVNLFRPCATNK